MHKEIQKQHKYKIKVEDILSLILLLYPLRKAAVGIDLMDAGYSLGNYRFFDSMNQTWKLATYLSNILGVLLSKLPFGDTWSGMNVYTGLLVGITAMCTYCFLIRCFDKKYLIFLGEIVALSLCWAPTVILYHYLGYIIMTAAVILLYKALTEGKNRLLAAAGILLGAAVLVRMPNITFMALILPVWYYNWLSWKKNGKCSAINNTMYCIAGYMIGLLIPLAFITVKYGFGSYVDMIGSLFGMTDTATDYKPTSMVGAMFTDYIQYSVWLWIFLVYTACGLLFFHFADKVYYKKNHSGKMTVFKILYVLGMAVLLRLCYGRGMFDFNYTSYFSMYKWVTVYFLVTIALCVFAIFSKKAEDSQKLWAVFLLVVIFVTPLGSNNGLYPLINNTFLLFPVSLCMMSWFVKTVISRKNDTKTYVTKEESDKTNNGYIFVIKSMLVFLISCVSVQSILFGLGFIFHDAPSDNKSSYAVLEPDKAGMPMSTKGMHTNVDKKQELEALGGYLQQNNLLEKQVLLYGDIPALAYIYDMEPAVYTTWPDLDSNPLDRLQSDLDSITKDFPVVILSAEPDSSNAKEKAIKDFLDKNSYVRDYMSNEFIVYVALLECGSSEQ